MGTEKDDKENSTREKEKKDNIVFIGEKPLMNYVTSVTMQFNVKNSPEVVIKARGKFISKAVDVAEVAKRRFLREISVGIREVSISTEEYKIKEESGKEKNINVSTIEITLAKENLS